MTVMPGHLHERVWQFKLTDEAHGKLHCSHQSNLTRDAILMKYWDDLADD
jgi:hypothetical protein